MAKNRSGKTRFQATRLTGTGCGIWRYDARGADETAAGDAVFYAPAFERYSMKEGDVVIVHAGSGSVFLVGV